MFSIYFLPVNHRHWSIFSCIWKSQLEKNRTKTSITLKSNFMLIKLQFSVHCYGWSDQITASRKSFCFFATNFLPARFWVTCNMSHCRMTSVRCDYAQQVAVLFVWMSFFMWSTSWNFHNLKTKAKAFRKIVLKWKLPQSEEIRFANKHQMVDPIISKVFKLILC